MLLEEYLDHLQEIEPTTAAGIVIGSMTFLMIVGGPILQAHMLVKTSKRHKVLEKKLKDILQDGRDWKIYIMKEKLPNAGILSEKPEIFVTSGLFKYVTDREVMAILLHEVGHIRGFHATKQGWSTAILVSPAIAAATTTLFNTATLVASALAPLAVMAILFTSHMIMLPMSRSHEYKADEHTIRYGYGKDLASALKKMIKVHQKGHSKLSKKIASYLDPHPTVERRVANILLHASTIKLILKNTLTKSDVVKHLAKLWKG